MLVLVNLSKIETKADDKKRDRGVDRGLGQHVTRLSAKGCFSHTAAHRCSHTTIGFRFLGEDNQDQKQRDEDEDKGKNADQNAHEKGKQSRAARKMSMTRSQE